MIVAKKVSFDAAHWLPNHSGKCKNLHGHHWEVELAVEGPVLSETGMVIDFGDLKKFLNYIVKTLDHSFLNDTLPNPTAENICHWILEKLLEDDWGFDPGMWSWIKVWESQDSYAMLRNL